MKFQSQNYHDEHAAVETGAYPDGTTKLTVRGRYRQVLCVATVYGIPNEQPAAGHVFIREYGDTAGVLRSLQDSGVVGRTNRIIETAVQTRDPLRSRPVHEVKLLNTEGFADSV